MSVLFFTSTTQSHADDIFIMSAASLKNALDDIGQRFEAETGVKTRVTYAGSSILARQIMQGAPADIFISASPEWVEVLDGAGLLSRKFQAPLLRNRLALIGPKGAQKTISLSQNSDFQQHLGGGRLAMALVSAVPAGQYGKEALVSLGIWPTVSNRVAQSDNVRGALSLVALGVAPLGVVYASDVIAEPRVALLDLFPEDSHSPILYPVALLKGSQHPKAQKFFNFLFTKNAQQMFVHHGFKPIEKKITP